jgi:uncharacterized protein YcnI
VSLPRPAARLGIVLAALIGLLTLGIGVASAHVTASSPDAAAGGFGKVVFRVPNESDTASTVRLRIQLPTDTPFAFVSYQPVAGWTATLTRTQLDPPVPGEDGEEITEAVSVVEFTAEPRAGIAPGQFQEFALSLGRFPDVDTLSFSTVQTYSDGTESAWIEPTVAGRPEPERPAPVLSLAAASDSAFTGATTAAADSTHDGETTNEPAGLALFLALLALFVGGSGVVLGWAARRRTVSS